MVRFVGAVSENVWIPAVGRIVVSGNGGADVIAGCVAARADVVWLRQEHVGVEAVYAGAFVGHQRAPCVDVFVRRMVGAVVVDRVDEVLVEGWVKWGDSVGFRVGLIGGGFPGILLRPAPRGISFCL